MRLTTAKGDVIEGTPQEIGEFYRIAINPLPALTDQSEKFRKRRVPKEEKKELPVLNMGSIEKIERISREKAIPMFLAEARYRSNLHLWFKSKPTAICGLAPKGNWAEGISGAQSGCGRCLRAAARMERENQEALKQAV